MEDDLSQFVIVPPGAASKIRRQLGLSPASPLKITYIPGPGDVAGTFMHWLARQHDPRVPIAAYSLMFYELASKLEATCQVVALHPVDAAAHSSGAQFRFDYLAKRPARGRWSYLLSEFLFARKLAAKVAEFDPHIVIAATHNPTSAWKRLAKGRRLVLSAHNMFWAVGSTEATWRERIKKAVLRRRARALDAAVCVSSECARQLAELTDGRVEGGVACHQVVAHYALRDRDRLRHLLFLGRIEEAKGVFLLLAAFEQLAAAHPELTLTFAGTGSRSVELHEALQRSAFSDRLRYAGHLRSDEVHELIDQSDLLVCPTMTTFAEGMPAVLREAAAHGVPSLVSSAVPLEDWPDLDGAVFEADDVVSLREGLRILADNPDEYRSIVRNTEFIRKNVYDRSLSWGSVLLKSIS